jgi:hypothetical protein
MGDGIVLEVNGTAVCSDGAGGGSNHEITNEYSSSGKKTRTDPLTDENMLPIMGHGQT